jgi:ribosomal-protein-alanine N-acetyltransferase
MLILALETVTRAGSAALWIDGACHAVTGDPTRTHGERLPGELLALLAQHHRSLYDVTGLAVVTGPGSFTGLRVGVATIQGLALAGQRRVVGMPTMAALAATCLPDLTAPAIVVPCLDGARGDVFFAAYRAEPLLPIEAAVEVIAASVAPPDSAAARVASLASAERLIVVGDAATRYGERLAAALPSAELLDAPRPMAAAAAEFAARRPDLAGAPHALRPIYVRRPDAVLARERAGLTGEPSRFAVRSAAGAADLAAVEALQRETFSNPWGADAIRWELENTDVARLFVLQVPDGPIVGYCACWVVFDELHINSLAVAPAWRRQGAARFLLTGVLGEAVKAGARSATLEVRASNDAARKLYEGLGFMVEGVRRDYYQDPREDALILWKRGL